ncbi:MAG: SPOR domain-containing protein [Acidobacteria bacterium]|nr:SPOR domain-containing protein [Acidobacteriota bacterium]
MNELSITPTDNSPTDYEAEEREITLGTGRVLALFFGLVLLCATFFAIGYSMGRNSTKAAGELLPAPATPAGSETRQEANSSPTAETPAEARPAAEPGSPDRNPAAGSPAPGAPSARSAAAGGTTGEAAAPAAAKPAAAYFVQVAAVTKQEDAEALVESLKGREYQAFIADSSPDQLFHVQLGPFSMKDAEGTKARLVNDGYNPILKKSQ